MSAKWSFRAACFKAWSFVVGAIAGLGTPDTSANHGVATGGSAAVYVPTGGTASVYATTGGNARIYVTTGGTARDFG